MLTYIVCASFVSVFIAPCTCRFGYADFSSKSVAQNAIKTLSETDLLGRNVRLDLANSRSNSSTTPRGILSDYIMYNHKTYISYLLKNL